MSLPAQTSLHKRYTGDGVTTAFAYDFLVPSSNELVVLVDGVPTTDYTLTGAGVVTGGSVVFFVAPALASTVVLYRTLSVEQQLTLVTAGIFSATSLEAALNRLCMLIQDVHEILSRVPTLADTIADTLRDVTFPSPADGSPLIGWNATLDALTLYANEITVETISPAAGHVYGRVDVTLNCADFTGTGEMRASAVLPANSTILGCPSIVAATLSAANGLTGYTVGDDAIQDRWGSSSVLTTGTALGDGNWNASQAQRTVNSAADLVVRSLSGTFGATGSVTVVIHYRQLRTTS